MERGQGAGDNLAVDTAGSPARDNRRRPGCWDQCTSAGAGPARRNRRETGRDRYGRSAALGHGSRCQRRRGGRLASARGGVRRLGSRSHLPPPWKRWSPRRIDRLPAACCTAGANGGRDRAIVQTHGCGGHCRDHVAGDPFDGGAVRGHLGARRRPAQVPRRGDSRRRGGGARRRTTSSGARAHGRADSNRPMRHRQRLWPITGSRPATIPERCDGPSGLAKRRSVRGPALQSFAPFRASAAGCATSASARRRDRRPRPNVSPRPPTQPGVLLSKRGPWSQAVAAAASPGAAAGLDGAPSGVRAYGGPTAGRVHPPRAGPTRCTGR